VLLEHYGGSFPTWLAPVQVRILPVTSAHEAHVASLVTQLAHDGFRVDTAVADEQLGKRIRAAKMERIPYVLVVGDDDVAANTVGVNPRGGEVQRDTPFATFIERLRADVREGSGR
jgi:threonyl-tRNA synthetase